MRAFDWERRAPPAGVIEIERTRHREFAIQALNEANNTFKGDKMRSQWESTSVKKAELVHHTLASLSLNANSEDSNDVHSSRKPRADITEDLRAEKAAKLQSREAERAGAAQRRLALLYQAKALEASKEENKVLALERYKAEAFQKSCPELRDLKAKGVSKELAFAWQQQLKEKEDAFCKAAAAAAETGTQQNSASWPPEERQDERCREDLLNDWEHQLKIRAAQQAEEKAANMQLAADLKAEAKRAEHDARQYKAARQEDQLHVRRQLDNALDWQKEESARRNAWQREQDQSLVQCAEDTWEKGQAMEAQRRAEREAKAAKIAAGVASWHKEEVNLQRRQLSTVDSAAEEAKRDALASEAAAARQRMQVETQKFNNAMLGNKRAQLEAERQQSLQERAEKELAAKAAAAEKEAQQAAKLSKQALFKASLGAQVASKDLQRAAKEAERVAAARAEEEHWREAVARARRQLNL